MKEKFEVYEFKAMANRFTLKALNNQNSQTNLKTLFTEVETVVKKLEEKYTYFKESYLTELNKRAVAGWTPIDKESCQLIDKSLKLSQRSKGAFDISFSSWRDPKKSRFENFLLNRISYRQIELDPKNQRVRFHSKDLKINLGGVVKGYAVDKAYERLIELGASNFLINGGGDFRVHSRDSAKRPWAIGIRNPLSSRDDYKAGYIHLKNSAMATSGSYNRFDSLDPSIHHIKRRFFKTSSNHLISASVIADTTLNADMSATLLMNLSIKKGLQYLKDHRLGGILIEADGKVHRHLPVKLPHI